MKKEEGLQIKSKALEININSYRIEVEIDPKYSVLLEVMSKYYGLMDGLKTFLKELSHPYKNWHFIVKEARSYSLDYFHLLRNHPKGHEAAELFVDIFDNAIESGNNTDVKIEAVDNLLLFLLKIIKDSGPDIERFMTVIENTFQRITHYPDDDFFLFVKSPYQLKKLVEALLNYSSTFTNGFQTINQLLLRYFNIRIPAG
jgi:pyruvate,orthophosphate dikinase